MKLTTWTRIILISSLITLLMSAFALLAFRSAAAPIQQESRRNVFMFLVNMLESSPYEQALDQYAKFRADTGSAGRTLWILDAQGHVIASNTPALPPDAWRELERPAARHGITLKTTRWGYFAELVLIRLDKPEPTFLLVKPEKDTPNKAMAGLEVRLLVISLFGTALTSLCATMLYLRGTSREARAVMARLHGGELGARFDIARMDQIASLKLDFNAMADEIERLVMRLRASETARRQMLAELSHDLRTPLTSLRTSIDTLRLYRDRMNPEQQTRCIETASNELTYFLRILEDLLLLAEIEDDPAHTTRVPLDVLALLTPEIEARRLTHPQCEWTLVAAQAAPTAHVLMQEHVLLRLLRNALDNASKYAAHEVTVTVARDGDFCRIEVGDDGQGIAPEAAANFGVRRTTRHAGGNADPQLSLGLGSVIMRTIAETHGGSISIAPQQQATHPTTAGTLLTIRLPLAPDGT